MNTPNEPQGMRESIESSLVNFTPEQVKASALAAVNDNLATIRGSGKPIEEIKGLIGAGVDAGLTAGVGTLQAGAQLLSFQPVKATKTAFKAATGTIKKFIEIPEREIALALAAGGQSLKMGKTVISYPAKAPIKAYHTVVDGYNRVCRMMEGSDTAPPLPPKASTPPPEAQAA